MNSSRKCTLTEFQNNTESILQSLQETGQPHVLTINGETKIVLHDADAYQKLLAHLDRLEAIEGIQRGLDSMKQNSGRPAKDVLDNLEKKLNMQ